MLISNSKNKTILFSVTEVSGFVDSGQSLEEEMNLLDKEITSLEAESGGVWGKNTQQQPPAAESMIPEQLDVTESMVLEQNTITGSPQPTPLAEPGPSPPLSASQQPTAGHPTPLSETAPPTSTPAVSQPLPPAESTGYQGELSSYECGST